MEDATLKAARAVCFPATARNREEEWRNRWMNGTVNQVDREAQGVRLEDDPVNHPNHYTSGSIEVIDYRRSHSGF